jgi:hypothetical protein
MGRERLGSDNREQRELNRVREAFGDILKRPTYWDIVTVPGKKEMVERKERYVAAYERVVASPDTDKEQLDADLTDIYCTGEGARMMLMGIKPAVYGFDKWDGTLEITRQYPEIKYAKIKHSDPDWGDTIIPFDPAQAQVVQNEYGDILRKLGYDPSDSPSKNVKKAFSSYDAIPMSLFLGYSLGGAVFHNLLDLASVESDRRYGPIAKDNLERGRKSTWEGLSNILSDEQFKLAEDITLKRKKSDNPVISFKFVTKLCTHPDNYSKFDKDLEDSGIITFMRTFPEWEENCSNYGGIYR